MSSSSSCRIVVVSSTLEGSRAIANRIKALSGDDIESDPSSDVLHWTIKNKYYTAPVHFQSIHMDGLESIELDNVPAVIYTWSEREPYKEHIKQISQFLTAYEPEVSLAISTAPSTEEELEDFFFEHGFEYIDGHNDDHRVHSVSSPDISDTPGIHRAIDALSSIMWPSMSRIESSRHSKLKSALKSNVPPDLENSDINVLELLNPDRADSKAQVQREMELLEEWLTADVQDEGNDEDSNDDEHDDYASLFSHADSTVRTSTSDPWSTGAQTTKPEEFSVRQGFEDDFTEFISAPAVMSQDAQSDEDESDSELPSKDDIRMTSARIFGLNPNVDFSSSPFMGIPANPQSLSSSGSPTGLSAYLQLDDDESVQTRELDMDGPAFDLSRILGALQGMKEEISQIPDEKERRNAAAKVALGLVYGLEGGESS